MTISDYHCRVLENLGICKESTCCRNCIPIPVDRHRLPRAQQVCQLVFLVPVVDHGIHGVPHGGRVVRQEAVAGLDGLRGLGDLGGLGGSVGGAAEAALGRAAGKVLQAEASAPAFRR